MTSEIAVSRAGGVQVIRIQRPDKKNALTSAMYAAMSTALSDGEARSDVAVHMFTGSNGVFSAGNDITDFVTRASAGARAGQGLGGPVLDFIRLLPRLTKPMVAAVDGLAIGIGTTMLLHCDLVYASPTARFQTPFLDLGIVPEAASSLLTPRIMGPQRAFELLVLGEAFSAERAQQAGFVNAVVPAVELEATALKAAARLAAKPPSALAMSRRLLRGDTTDVCRRVDEEAVLFAERLASPEAREAFAAFLEKRPADFAKLKKT